MLRRLISLLCLIFLLGPNGCNANFQFVSAAKTWAEAQSHCRSLHRDLASIHNNADMVAARSVIPSSLSISTEVWLGAKYFGNPGSIDKTNWHWTDYSPFEYYNWTTPTYPNPSTGSCLTVSRDSTTKFQNANCAVARPFVCGHAFGFYPAAAHYYHGTARCGSNRMASIHSLADAEQVHNRCGNHNCWVGARWVARNNRRYWEDGTNYGFELPWANGHPHNYETTNCVGMITPSKTLFRTYPCGEWRNHVCNPGGGAKACNARQVPAKLSSTNLPASGIRVEVDMAKLTMTFHILVEMVGPQTTPIIDFTPFVGDLRNVTNCENRRRSDFRQVFWRNLWTDAFNPTGKSWHISGVSSNLMYPSTEGTKWKSTRLHCRTMYYTATFTWNELYGCRQRDGSTRSIQVIDTPTSFGMDGYVYLTAVSPVDPLNSNARTSDYFGKALRQFHFSLQLTKAASVSSDVNSEIVDVSVLQEWIETINGTARVMFRVRTRAANSLRLTSAQILNPPSDVVNPAMTTETGHQSCIAETGAPGVCLQTWILSFDRQTCPHSYLNTLRTRFIIECQTTTPGTLLDNCNSIKALIGNVSGVVAIEAEVRSQFYDVFCTDVSRFGSVPMDLNLSATLTGARVDPAFPFAAGQSVFITMAPKYAFRALQNGIVSQYQLSNMWFCIGNGTGLVNAQPNGNGGCFPPSSVQQITKVHDGATSKVAPGWTVTKHKTSPALVFEMKFPPISSSAIFLHVQVQIVPVLSSSSRRRLLSGGVQFDGKPFYLSSHATTKIYVNNDPRKSAKLTRVPLMNWLLFVGSALVACIVIAVCARLYHKKKVGMKREREMAETSSGGGLTLDKKESLAIDNIVAVE